MVARVQVRDTVARIAAVWPRLASDKHYGLRQEIGGAIMRHADALDLSDLEEGVAMLISSARAQQDDGGPAAPPGPHEVLGCVLAAKRARLADARGGAATRDTSARVTALDCRRASCKGSLMWLPVEGMHYCRDCNTCWPEVRHA